MDYEDVLHNIGGCGRFQLTAFSILSICTFKVAMDIQTLVFIIFTPAFVCADSLLSNETCEVKLNGRLSKCTRWNYSDAVFRKSMVTEMDLVCEREYYGTLVQTLTFAGAIVGMCIGSFGDIIGRRKLLLIQAAWDTTFSTAVALTPGLYPQLVLRFLRGFSNGIYYTGAAYISEIVSIKYRMNLGCNYYLMWCLGYSMCAGFGKWLLDWRLIQGVSALITLVYISYIFLIPESPRWLILKGRSEEAAEVFAKMARWNGKTIPVKFFENIKVSKEPEGRLFDLFRSRQMCLKTLACWLLLWSFGCTYMAASLNSSFAINDIFINMAVMGIVEIPASPISWLISDKIGRRRSFLLFNLITAVCLFMLPFLKPYLWAKAVVAVLAKFVITASFCVGDVWIVECFPTCIRNIGLFTSSTWSNSAFMLAPIILKINKPVTWMPEAILFVQTLIALLALLVLPETKGAPLLQTVEEADMFVVGKESEIHQLLLAKRESYRLSSSSKQDECNELMQQRVENQE